MSEAKLLEWWDSDPVITMRSCFGDRDLARGVGASVPFKVAWTFARDAWMAAWSAATEHARAKEVKASAAPLDGQASGACYIARASNGWTVYSGPSALIGEGILALTAEDLAKAVDEMCARPPRMSDWNKQSGDG